ALDARLSELIEQSSESEEMTDREAGLWQFRLRETLPRESSIQLLERTTLDGTLLAVVDRATGMATGHLSMPGQFSAPSDMRAGHFLPLGTRGAIQGASLLERGAIEPLWTHWLDRSGLQEPAHVGPSGPSFCTFQTRQELIVVDPSSGRVLWQRNNLNPHSGFWHDPQRGLIGDSEALVLFEEEDSNFYTVYRTATGEVIRQGRLESDGGSRVLAFGRKLLYFARPTAQYRTVRLWDPLDDRVVLEGKVFPQTNITTTPDGELVLVLAEPSPRIIVFDVAHERMTLEMPLQQRDLVGLTGVEAFRDGGRYYVNLQRRHGRGWQGFHVYQAAPSLVPSVDVQGDLYALDRETGKLLWRRDMGAMCSVLDSHVDHLPFLIALRRVRDREDGEAWQVEAIDKQTGRKLGSAEGLRPGRLIRVEYQPLERRVELHGQRSLIRLQFDRPVRDDRPI
ncbi:MAG: PQQ-binding-like beta-propeller repeat protein, partial [Planctomycetaceae bacterium]